MVEIALRLVERGLGQRIRRELLERQIGIAKQLVLRGGNLLLQQFELRARGNETGGRVVEVELRADIALDQRRLAVDVAPLQVDALMREVAHLAVDLDVAFQRVVIGLGGGEIGLRLLQRQPERHRVDFEQRVAFVDALAFADHDLFDLAGNVGGDRTFWAPT